MEEKYIFNEDTVYDFVEMLKALADSSRLKIIHALMDGTLCVSDISEKTGLGQSLVSHHLSILRAVRAVKPRREGKNIYYTIDDDHVKDIFVKGMYHVSHK